MSEGLKCFTEFTMETLHWELASRKDLTNGLCDTEDENIIELTPEDGFTFHHINKYIEQMNDRQLTMNKF